jgi:hypothetical protein
LGRLGPYRVLKVLGTGGMGVVFLAEDTLLQRTVAVKTLKPALAADESYRRRFLREARTAAKVEDDHIVPVYSVGEEGTVPYLAMPLLKGQSLETLLCQTNVLEPREVMRLELADGRGTGGGARARGDPPRLETRQRLAGTGRRASETARLRPGAGGGR